MTDSPPTPQQQPHPIVNRAFALLEGKSKKEPELTDQDRARLTEVLDAIEAKEELEKAILDLLVVGQFFETQGIPKLFEAFFTLVKSGGYLTRAGLERQMASKDDAQRFLGTSRPTEIPGKRDPNGMSLLDLRAGKK